MEFRGFVVVAKHLLPKREEGRGGEGGGLYRVRLRGVRGVMEGKYRMSG